MHLSNSNPTTWLLDLVYTNSRFASKLALVCDDTIAHLAGGDEVENAIRLKGRALLPGLINAHSHAFQRVIRGRTEYRTASNKDSFWTWRAMMYSAALRPTPEDVYDASRMAFFEIAVRTGSDGWAGYCSRHAPDGSSYDDPNLIAKEVV